MEHGGAVQISRKALESLLGLSKSVKITGVEYRPSNDSYIITINNDNSPNLINIMKRPCQSYDIPPGGTYPIIANITESDVYNYKKYEN